ncbi:MAG: sugar ABC transporter ATP-binding protein [Actinomycetota bacterium]|nr:MAG: sugar ABC transporter ATP-binding protein [Actinomycetota bacterium]
MNNISKYFPGVHALDGVTFKLEKKQVFAIVGENGAGKSTLIKILSGSYSNDHGQIKIDGKKIYIRNPMHAMQLGINTIYQETSLVPEITVAENIFLGRQPTKGGRIQWKKMYDGAQRIMKDLSIDLDPRTKTSNLSPAKHQLIEIAKAFSREAKIIIMDEPTAAITEEDTESLFNIIREIIKKGTAVIYISHRLKEIFQIADMVTVLRDGKTVETMKVSQTSESDIVKYMVGRDIGDIFGEKSYEATEDIMLEVRNLTRIGFFKDISFNLKKGEILGLSGLVGAGRSEIVRSIFGLDRLDSGEIYIEGQKVNIKNSTDGINKGLAFVSEDRRIESIIPGFTVRENLSILLLKQVLTGVGLISRRKESKLARKYVDDFSIKTPSIEQLVMNLSGGNQQKVALAKNLSTDPKILILDEPTKGIDVGAKKEIHTLIKELANSGIGIIMVSSELPEIIGMCHRVLVIREGRISKEFKKEELNESDIMHASVGNI